MVRALLTGEEALLRRLNKVDDDRHDLPSDSCRHNPIIGIGDADGSSIRDKARTLLRKEKKKTLIKTQRGGLTSRHGTKNIEEDRGGQVWRGLPGSKRDTIRTCSGVITSVNSVKDVVERDIRAKVEVDPFVVISEKRFESKRGGVNYVVISCTHLQRRN